MALTLTSAQIDRLVNEAGRWGRNYDSQVTEHFAYQADNGDIIQYVLVVDGVGKFVSVGTGDMGVGSEYVDFACVHDSENNPRFYLNGL